MKGDDRPKFDISPIRRRMMQAVRGANTKPEIAVRKMLFALGYRYRIHVRDLPGTPDIVFSARRIAIFIHGCFWHRHPHCRYATTPKTRAAFWVDKFERNVARDAMKRAKLEAAGWKVVELWECQVRGHDYLDELIEKLGPTRVSQPQLVDVEAK